MSQIELDNSNVAGDGRYRLNPAYSWFVLIGGTLVVLFLLIGGMVELSSLLDSAAYAPSEQPAHPWILLAGVVVFCAWLIFAMGSVAKLSRQILQVDREGILITNTQGAEIGGVRWAELSKVTATNKMDQLVLWDGAGNRRVVIDRNIDNFERIRARILAEYARVFTAAPLPFEFRRTNFWTADAIACVAAATLMGLLSVAVYRNGQPGSGILLLCLFQIPFSVYFLSINPQLFGPSKLFDDRIELSGLFRRTLIYKKDVGGVEIADFTAAKSGMTSVVLIKALGGKQFRIQQRYGSLPEIYLTLRAWLNQ